MGQIKKIIKVEIPLFLASIASGILCLMLSTGAEYSIEIYFDYFSIPSLVILNVAPVVVFIFILYGIIGRPWVAYGLGSATSFIISVCNWYKLTFRDDPLYFEDITLIREAVNMSSSYSIVINKKFILIAAVFFLLTILLYKLSNKKINRERRCIIIVLTITISYCSLSTYKADKLYNSFENYAILNRWSSTQEYISKGFFYPFIHSMFQYKEIEPDGYDKKIAEALLAGYSDSDIPEDKKVNVIIVMREAYADFSRYDIEGFDNSSYDLFHQLKEDSYTGDLLVNAFGGGTIDTERGFLTGDYVLRNFRGNTNSYVWYFRDQGYTAEGNHPFYQWFYNRRNVNNYLGFSGYRYYEDTYGALTESYYPEDELMYRQILRDFTDNKASGKPYFSFNLNVQSHGPYNIDYYMGEKEYLKGDQYSMECKNAMDNYMDKIMDSDKQLINFLQILEEEEEPVVFVLFSDHLPWMGDGNAYYTEMGIDFSEASEEMNRLQYTTEYLIWGNESARQILGDRFTGEGPTISPCYLMNILFERCQWEGPGYMQTMEEMRSVFPVVSTGDKYIIDDKFTYEIPENRKELFRKFLYLQFYWRNEFMY